MYIKYFALKTIKIKKCYKNFWGYARYFMKLRVRERTEFRMSGRNSRLFWWHSQKIISLGGGGREGNFIETQQETFALQRIDNSTC